MSIFNDNNQTPLDQSYNNKVVRIISEQHAREKYFYYEKTRKVFLNANTWGDSKASLSGNLLGEDLVILKVGENAVLVKRLNIPQSIEFFTKLFDWTIDYVYTPEKDPEYYV